MNEWEKQERRFRVIYKAIREMDEAYFYRIAKGYEEAIGHADNYVINFFDFMDPMVDKKDRAPKDLLQNLNARNKKIPGISKKREGIFTRTILFTDMLKTLQDLVAKLEKSINDKSISTNVLVIKMERLNFKFRELKTIYLWLDKKLPFYSEYFKTLNEEFLKLMSEPIRWKKSLN